jgi:murE/murF fusion protein
MALTLRELIDGVRDARAIGDTSIAVGAVRDDSRAVAAGDVFVAVRGLRADGHDFVATAISRGAAAIVVERELPGISVPQVIVPSGGAALGVLVARSLGDPGKAMTLIAVTGTNGKTTTTYLVEAILTAAGHKAGVIGTVELRWPGHAEPASYTTPTPHMLHETLAKMRAAGCTHVVMEVTSIALAMHRVAGMEFAVAAFSNLTQDHLDYHGSMEAYRDAKRLLFKQYLKPHGISVLNVDDPEGLAVSKAIAGRVIRVSTRGDGDGGGLSPDGSAAGWQRGVIDVKLVTGDSTVRGIRASFGTKRGTIDVVSAPLIGSYNVDNIALAVGIGEALQLPQDAIARGIAALPGVPGRVERVANDAELDILVDYAHTPDALRNVLAAVRPLTARRLICVFGCGGDRDPGKRPKMGAAVAELADVVIVTSDNPRTEDPRKIIDAILPAVPSPFVVDVDRRVAIRAAIAEATPGDVVVIAGKGHEDYQILGTTKHHFDDREEAAEAVLWRWRRSLAALADDCGGVVKTDVAAPASRDSMHMMRVDPGSVTRILIDSRRVAKGDLYVAIRGEAHDGHAFCAAALAAGASAVLVEKDRVTGSRIEVADTRIALGLLGASHRRRWTGKLVAITGSAGKTTTKELTRSALAEVGATSAAEGSFNNETGLPQALLALREHHKFGVVEMGMRGAGQIEYLTKLAEPDIAVVVNAGTAHIELLGSTDAIAHAKAEIWLGVRDGGVVVRPADDPRLAELARAHRPKARHVTFGDVDTADVRLASYTADGDGSRIIIEAFGEQRELRLQLLGRHVAIDACAALAAAHSAGASIEQALAGLARARPPSLRGEVVEIAGRHVIVDCYNANPASMSAALRMLAERAHGRTKLAVIGDMLELGEHANKEHAAIGALCKELGLGVIALGEFAPVIVDAASSAETSPDPAEAAARTLARTQAGDWVLVKASRGMKLERVVDELRKQAGR